MSESTAFCPQCKRDVQFQARDGRNVCPACGFSYAPSDASVPPVISSRRPLGPGPIVLFILWILLPSFLALGLQDYLFDPKHGLKALFPYVLILTAANSLVAALWLTRRTIRSRFLAIFLGLFLAGTIFGMNVTAVFLAECAIMLSSGKL
jgi:hypothetical protein